MAAKTNPGGLVVAIITCPGLSIATITHPTGNGYSQDKILRDSALKCRGKCAEWNFRKFAAVLHRKAVLKWSFHCCCLPLCFSTHFSGLIKSLHTAEHGKQVFVAFIC